MSTTVPTQREVRCGYCDEKYTNGTGIKGSFCSRDCWHESKGQNILTQIATDHTYCSSCYNPLKTIEEPPETFLQKREGIRDAIVGFQYYTEFVNKEHGFTFCQCGNIDHYAENEILRNVEFTTAVKNLARLLAEYYTDNQIAEKPNVRILARTLKETDNVALAIGRSIYE